MKWMKPLVVATVLLTMAGCASQKSWTSVGGSRADGSVKLGYVVNMFEKPVVSQSQGDANAASVCQRWGYDSAEAFGMSSSKCQRTDGYGNCTQSLVTREWQCINDTEQARGNELEDVNALGPIK